MKNLTLCESMQHVSQSLYLSACFTVDLLVSMIISDCRFTCWHCARHFLTTS
jgi:hypothetical protein